MAIAGMQFHVEVTFSLLEREESMGGPGGTPGCCLGSGDDQVSIQYRPRTQVNPLSFFFIYLSN